MILLAERELDAGVEKEGTEEPHHPLVTLDELRPQKHEREPHEHGAEDAPEEHAVLVLERHAEIAEHHREHEHVVHRQRPLDEISGEKLEGRLAAEPPPDEPIEAKGQGRPETGPEGALTERRLLGVLVKDREVEGQHHDHEGRERRPVEVRDQTRRRGVGESIQRNKAGGGAGRHDHCDLRRLGEV